METNIIHCGDCLEVMKEIKDETIDLIYLDPPFFSRKDYENFWIKDKVTRFKFSDKDWEKLRKSIKPDILRQYEDIEKRWKGGHRGIYVYIAYMRERLEQCWRILKPIGSIYLHCDWHAGHYLKIMMDEIFGYNNFRNEIVWCYTGPSRNVRDFPDKHDTILRYVKGDTWIFNPNNVRKPYTESFLERRKHVEGSGGIYAGKGRHTEETLKEYQKGKVMEDWWIDIPSGGQISRKELLGYPTQKPEALLERIIKASSNEGDIVLDPFCGCGTTIVVAKRLKRKWFGIDISRTACDVMRKRLGGDVMIVGGESEKELKKMEDHEFARYMIVEKMGGTVNPRKTGDFGIDGWAEFRTIPVQVKKWGAKVGRQEVDKFKSAIQRDHKTKGIIVAFDFTSGCHSEVARIKDKDKIDIELKKVKDIISY